MDLLPRVVSAFEAFSSRIYVDAAGKPTIGYGHVLKPGEDFSDGLSREQAMVLLDEDIKIAKVSVDALFRGVYLAPYELDALTSFVFNVGGGQATRESTLRQYVLKSNRLSAAGEFLRWVHITNPDGTKRKAAGLIRRRDTESVWYLGAHRSTLERMAGLPPESD